MSNIIDSIQISGTVYTVGQEASSAVTSGDTNAVSGDAVYTQMGGMKIVKLTQQQYDDLINKDSSTIYYIVG